MVKVWFNHWFSTVYGLIELIKQDKNEQIYVIVSNRVEESVIQAACDEWYKEPDIDGEDYIRFCLDFCREHGIDVFIPRRKMTEISENIHRFNEIGVKVMVDDFETIAALNDKIKSYELLRDCKGVNIPEYRLASTVSEFRSAYEALRKTNDIVCMKFVRDEGALSFRRISEKKRGFDSLRRYQGSEIFYDDLIEMLEEQKDFPPIMVMSYLGGSEISIDCLDTDNGLIAVPRVKTNGRHEYVDFNDENMPVAVEIMKKLKLNFPCNIQFRYKDNVPYFLEVNTRMSGGLQMSCLATGVNIPNIALNKLLGRETQWEIDKSEKVVSYIEIPKIIKK